MAAMKKILVTGATGKQGGALISALLANQANSPFHLVALTRDANSSRAQILKEKPNVSVLEGDFNDCNAIFEKSSDPFYGVFSVQTPLKPKVEEQQGKALVDAASANGVKHFVYTSAERGGPSRSDGDGTRVKHFASKYNIENHLKSVAQNKPGMEWTIIRPVAFMDNLTPDFLGRAFATMWQLNGPQTKLQLVSTASIGILAADIFTNPENYRSKAISLATDELSPTEANAIFKSIYHQDIPVTYQLVGRTIKVLLREQLGEMFDWFREVGFGADPNEYTSKFPEMQNFQQWLLKSSQFPKPAQ